MQWLAIGAIVVCATGITMLALIVGICVPPGILQAKLGRVARSYRVPGALGTALT
jgi:hypothetical protein